MTEQACSAKAIKISHLGIYQGMLYISLSADFQLLAFHREHQAHYQLNKTKLCKNTTSKTSSKDFTDTQDLSLAGR